MSPPTPTSEAVPQRNDVPACRVWYVDPGFENTQMSQWGVLFATSASIDGQQFARK